MFFSGASLQALFLVFRCSAAYIDLYKMTHFEPAQIERRLDWEVALETIKIFGGIVITIIVVGSILTKGESDLSALLHQPVTSADVLHNNGVYFGLTGILSGFTRNASACLIFFNSAGGDFSALQGIIVVSLLAIFARTVFIGASVYIQDRLKFITKSIAGCRGIPMSGFLGMIRCGGAIFDAVVWSCHV